MRKAGVLRNTSSAYKNRSLQFYPQTHTVSLWLLDSTVSACVTETLEGGRGGGDRAGGVVGNKPHPSDQHTSHVRPHPTTDPHCMICKNTRPTPTRSLLLALVPTPYPPLCAPPPPPLLLLLYTCLTCLTASFVISNHLLSERLWQTGVLAASVWCWELGFPAE